MTSQIEKGLDEEALLIAQKAAEDAYMAEVYEGLAFDGAIAAGIRAYLTATGESKTESSPEVAESLRAGLNLLLLSDAIRSCRFDAIVPSVAADQLVAADALLQRLAALSVGREGAAQGRDAVRVKALEEKTQGWKDDKGRFCLPLSEGYVIKFPPEKSGLYMVWFFTNPIAGYAELKDAFAAANAHHEARILSALDTSPEGMVEERI